MSQISAITSNPNVWASTILIDIAGVQSVPAQTWKGSFAPCWAQESFQYRQKSNVEEYIPTARKPLDDKKSNMHKYCPQHCSDYVLFKYTHAGMS